MNRQWLLNLLVIGVIASVVLNVWAYDLLLALIQVFHELMIKVYVTGVSIAVLCVVFRPTRMAFPLLAIPLALAPAIIAGTGINFFITNEQSFPWGDAYSLFTLGSSAAFIVFTVLSAVGDVFLQKMGK